MSYKSDIEIAREANMVPIQQIGAKLSIPEKDLLPFGHDKAKISAEFIKAQRDGKGDGKLVLVTAINPTPAGEGKTTTTVGLGDGLNALGKKAMICIREASLGPCFGMKGGAAGGGYAQVVPMEEMNLHFTGDFHAITSAHNLLSAMIDNHIYWGNELEIDQRRVTWRRVVDMNDRALRDIVTSLGGVSNGFPRQAGFDITVASEVMAILCLALDIEDLQKRLGDIIVAYRRDRSPVYCPRYQSGWGDDGFAQPGDAAKSCADTGKQPRLCAWRPLCQYRAWLYSGGGHDDSVEAGRLCCHRGWLWCRSGCREIREHQVSQGWDLPQRRCSGGNGAGNEDEWRCSQGRSRCGKCSLRCRRAVRILAAISKTSNPLVCRWWLR